MGSRGFLIGGGWDAAAARAVYGPFLRAAAGPRIGCVVLDEGDGGEQFGRYDAALRKVADCSPVPLLVPLGGAFDPGAVPGLDGVLVCGGLTPAYQEAFAGCLDQLRSSLAELGIPYAGFSAGAAVAARHAVVGGWLDDGVPVCHEDTAEDLAEVEVRAGLGLVPFAVDVHAAQWGTLPRMIAAVTKHGLPHGVAIDENTVVEVGADGRARVSGLGRAHSVQPSVDGSVLVRSYGAGEFIPAVPDAPAE
ncbi:Type 1 glutamine amidotransferase-like domain-containing protein [Streptomyces sp. NPDC001401]|uniref:Type 1 glutamine amidotransferase-like domain-containing protein n=1 Tax=Streptomyces sp. NPDC001401 TaxID=3364570 RepID=UPI0036C5CCD3